VISFIEHKIKEIKKENGEYVYPAGLRENGFRKE